MSRIGHKTHFKIHDHTSRNPFSKFLRLEHLRTKGFHCRESNSKGTWPLLPHYKNRYKTGGILLGLAGRGEVMCKYWFGAAFLHAPVTNTTFYYYSGG